MTSASIVDSLGSILPQPGAKAAGVLAEGEEHPTFSDVLNQTSAKCGAPCSGTLVEGETGKPGLDEAAVTELQATTIQIAGKDTTIELLAAGDVSATALALVAGALQQGTTTEASPLASLIQQKIGATGTASDAIAVGKAVVADPEAVTLVALPEGIEFKDIAELIGRAGSADASDTIEVSGDVELTDITTAVDTEADLLGTVATTEAVDPETAATTVAIEPTKDAVKASLSGAVANVVAATVAAASADKPVTEEAEKEGDAPLSGIIDQVTDLAARTSDDQPAKTQDIAGLQPVAAEVVDAVARTEFDSAKTVSPAIAAAASAAKTSSTTVQQTVIETQAVAANVADVQPVQSQTTTTAAFAATAPQETAQTQVASGATATLPMRDSTWTSQLVDTISVHDFGDGQTLDIQLTPETLGRLKITMEMRDGQAMVSVVTDNPEAARLFNDNQSRLADVMAKAGLTLASHDAGTGAQSGGSGDNAQGDGSVLTASGADTQTQTEDDVIMKVGGEQPQVNVVA